MADDQRLLAGRYVVGDLIGRGGMSNVFRGVDTKLGRTVAIKVLKSTLATYPAFRSRFRQEAQAASRMAHPTIVRVYDAGEERVKDGSGHDLIEPFILFAGLHDAWSRISDFLGDFWAELGLLVVALLVVYFGFVLFDRSKPKKK